MKTAAIGLSAVLIAGTANAGLLAGWDFSQYAAPGSLSGGAGNTLSANYSSLDPNGAGAESALTGTLYFDGSNGSSAGATVAPIANDTVANRNAPLDVAGSGAFPINVFDAFNTLKGEGQANQSRIALSAGDEDLVFQAGNNGLKWAGITLAGFALDPEGAAPAASVDVDVLYASDCSSYSFVDSITLTAAESAFDVSFGAGDGGLAPSSCVLLDLDPSTASGSTAVIDNVGIYFVPEPGAFLSLGTSLLTLAYLARRRRA